MAYLRHEGGASLRYYPVPFFFAVVLALCETTTVHRSRANTDDRLNAKRRPRYIIDIALGPWGKKNAAKPVYVPHIVTQHRARAPRGNAPGLASQHAKKKKEKTEREERATTLHHHVTDSTRTDRARPTDRLHRPNPHAPSLRTRPLTRARCRPSAAAGLRRIHAAAGGPAARGRAGAGASSSGTARRAAL